MKRRLSKSTKVKETKNKMMKNVLTFGIKSAALAIKLLVICGQDFVVAGPADSQAAALIQGKKLIIEVNI